MHVKKNADLTHAGIVCKEIKSRVNKLEGKRNECYHMLIST